MSGFAVGDVVEVKPVEEILAGLDERGERGALPFMPEMLQFCGKRFVVDKIAFKTCDTAGMTGMRRLEDTVHLAGLRCDGQAHGGCQAGCLIFWKADWLRRTATGGTGAPGEAVSESAVSDVVEVGGDAAPAGAPVAGCTSERLDAVASGACRPESERAAADGPLYSCQATELPRAYGEVLSGWKMRQYVEDIGYGNATVSKVFRGIAVGGLNKTLALSRRVLPEKYHIKGGVNYPFIKGTARKVPVETLDLQPGEWVRVKSAEEIAKTLGPNNLNRGLSFDREMLKYCGRTAKVLRRVDHIIEESTGWMITMKTPSVILDDVVCSADFHRSCPRAIYAYWREIWLERVTAPVARDAVSAGLPS